MAPTIYLLAQASRWRRAGMFTYNEQHGRYYTSYAHRNRLTTRQLRSYRHPSAAVFYSVFTTVPTRYGDGTRPAVISFRFCYSVLKASHSRTSVARFHTVALLRPHKSHSRRVEKQLLLSRGRSGRAGVKDVITMYRKAMAAIRCYEHPSNSCPRDGAGLVLHYTTNWPIVRGVCCTAASNAKYLHYPRIQGPDQGQEAPTAGEMPDALQSRLCFLTLPIPVSLVTESGLNVHCSYLPIFLHRFPVSVFRFFIHHTRLG